MTRKFRVVLPLFLMTLFLIGRDLTASVFASDASCPDAPWPRMEKELVLTIETGPNNPRNSEGDFIALSGGEILYVYTHYYGDSGDDNATAYLASRRSSDGGKTWTQEDKIEIPNEGQLNVMSVTCRRLADGRIALFYLVKESAQDCRPYLRYSTDEGTSWGPRIPCAAEPSYNVVNNDRVHQLASGRLLVPVALHSCEGFFHSDADLFCLYSDDGGQTWTRGESAAKISGVIYQEPGVCELADGRILMNIRTDAGRQYYAYSDDGITWGTPFPSPLDSPLSPTVIKRIPKSGELLAVGNPKIDLPNVDNDRAAMTIERLSPDGQKILTRKTLEYPPQSYNDWQYPAIHFIDEKTILAAYFSWPGGIRVYRMNLNDL